MLLSGLIWPTRLGKKLLLTIRYPALVVLLLLSSCNQEPVMDLPNLDLPPVTIHYQANETNTIESFQADVEVYSGVDRIPEIGRASCRARV